MATQTEGRPQFALWLGGWLVGMSDCRQFTVLQQNLGWPQIFKMDGAVQTVVTRWLIM
jgi:hypothetical protein